MVRAMCEIQLMDRKASTNLLFILGLGDTHGYGKQCLLVW